MAGLYDKLKTLVLPEDKLELYRMPQRDPDYPYEVRRRPPRVCACHGISHSACLYASRRCEPRGEFEASYVCTRCKTNYQVDQDGVPLPSAGSCRFHPGHFLFPRGIYGLAKRYTCCEGPSNAPGCSWNAYHVQRGERLLANYTGFVETRPKEHLEPDGHGVFAVDCEMCFTTVGLELVTVTVLDHSLQVVYNEKVRPAHQVLDYNTSFTGLGPSDLAHVSRTLADVQRDLLSMFSSKSILVGHSIDNDLKALKLIHKTFIETTHLYPHRRGLPFRMSLKMLVEQHLNSTIQEGDYHTGEEDASAALRLVLRKAKSLGLL